MSLVKKYCLSSFKYMNISPCCYLFSENRVNRAQYYTCLNNSANVQTGLFKYIKSVESSKRPMSAVQSLREKSYYLGLMLKKFSQDFVTYLPFYGGKHKRLGYLWFSTLDQVNMEDFFTRLKLADTFYSRFQIVELHVWMLLFHLPKVTRIDRFIRIGLIEAMWEDSQKRAKMVAEINVNYKKNFRALYGEFLFSQVFYDYCFIKSDATLSSAVWCNFFNKEDVDPRLIEAVVSYIRFQKSDLNLMKRAEDIVNIAPGGKQMHHLNKINFADLCSEGKICNIWAPAGPHFDEFFKRS